MTNIYIENGYNNREEYLNCLRFDYGDDLVNHYLKKFDPSQDFGQLIHAIEEAFEFGDDEDDDEDDWEYEDDE